MNIDSLDNLSLNVLVCTHWKIDRKKNKKKIGTVIMTTTTLWQASLDLVETHAEKFKLWSYPFPLSVLENGRIHSAVSSKHLLDPCYFTLRRGGEGKLRETCTSKLIGKNHLPIVFSLAYRIFRRRRIFYTYTCVSRHGNAKAFRVQSGKVTKTKGMKQNNNKKQAIFRRSLSST